MLVKLAIWFLNKKNVTVMINCKFRKVLTIGVKNNVYHENNEYVGGTTFSYENGAKYILPSVEEMDE